MNVCIDVSPTTPSVRILMDTASPHKCKRNNSMLHSLVRTVEIVTKDIGMKFRIDKCGVLAMKKGREVECDRVRKRRRNWPG